MFGAFLRGEEVDFTLDGVTQPNPAPRFSRTPGAIRRGPPGAEGTDKAADGRAALKEWGVDTSAAAASGALGAAAGTAA